MKRAQFMVRALIVLLLGVFGTQAIAAGNSAAPKVRTGTGFGVNDFRGFNTDGQTEFFFEGQRLLSPPDASLIGLGSRVNVRLAENANQTLTEGGVDQVFIETALRGPITAVSPALRVLGQALQVTADTVLVNIPNISQLQVGQILEVSGQIDANNSLIATRVELRQSANTWRLTGFLSAIGPAANSVNIGVQTVDYTGITAENCPAPLTVGLYVEVRANPISPFASGQPVNSVTRFRCGALTLPGTIGAPGVVDGLIASVVSPTVFNINAVAITHGINTLFRNGAAEDLAPGVRVEVEGIYTAGNAISANKIRFNRPTVRLQAPVAPADVIANTSILILGKLVKFTPQTRDEDDIVALGLASTQMVEVRAYQDSAGVLFATRVRERGNVKVDEYKAIGPALDINVPAASFKVLGINVEATVSAFLNAQEQPITRADFFAALTNGRLAGIENAFYNATTNTLSGGSVSLEDDDFTDRPEAGNAVSNGVLSGTLTEVLLDSVFSSDFE